METLMVLGIIGAISLSLMATINKVLDKVSSSKSMTSFVHLVNNIYTRYKAEGSYEELTVEKLCTEKVAPYEMIVGTKIFNSKGEEINVEKSGEQDDIFAVTVPNVSKRDCMEYLNIEWYSENGANIYSVTIKAVLDENTETGSEEAESTEEAITSFTWATTEEYNERKNLPITMPMIASVCKDSNNITWEFH